MVKEQKLVQDWFGGNWPEPSRVTFHPQGGKRENHRNPLLHENVAEDEAEEFKQGWKDYYLGPMKSYVG